MISFEDFATTGGETSRQHDNRQQSITSAEYNYLPEKRSYSLSSTPPEETSRNIVQNLSLANSLGVPKQHACVNEIGPFNSSTFSFGQSPPFNAGSLNYSTKNISLDNAEYDPQYFHHNLSSFQNFGIRRNSGNDLPYEPMIQNYLTAQQDVKTYLNDDVINHGNLHNYSFGTSANSDGFRSSAEYHSPGLYINQNSSPQVPDYTATWVRKRVTPVGLKETLKKEVEESVESFPEALNTALKCTRNENGEEEISTQVHKKFLITANRYYMGSSKYKGVCYNKKKNKWRARISNHGKREFLGDWESEVEAALIYDARVKQLYSGSENLKERLNFPDGVQNATKNEADNEPNQSDQ